MIWQVIASNTEVLASNTEVLVSVYDHAQYP